MGVQENTAVAADFTYSEKHELFLPKNFDYEGIIVLPAVDLAWMLIRSGSEYLKQRFPEDRVDKFDKWDDEAWLNEHLFLRKEDGKIIWYIDGLKKFFHNSTEYEYLGHSTGTTPIIADFIAACNGMNDRALIDFVGVQNYINGTGKTIIQETPGIEELLKYSIEHGGAYILTNSHPVMSLATAYKYGIPSSHVFAHGRQLSEDRLRYFDSKRKEMEQEGRKFDMTLFEQELNERSPLNVLSSYPRKLEEITDQILSNRGEAFDALQAGNVDLVTELNKQYHLLFDTVAPEQLREELIYQLRDEKGIGGGHNKVWNMLKVSRNGEVFVDDSIVGADGLAYGKYGFAINNKDPYCLHSCLLNFVVPDFSRLVPVYEDIDNGRFGIRRVERYSGLVAFYPRDIREDLKNVIDANGEMKKRLKSLYVS